MRVLVVGAGAIGTLFGARLARSGQVVVLVARTDQLNAIRSAGVRVTGSLEAVVPVEAIPAVHPTLAPDLVLMTSKAYDLDRLSVEVGQHLRPTLTLALQNGLGIRDQLLEGLRRGGWPDPTRWGWSGINSVPATLVAPGVVRQAGGGEVVLPSRTAEPALPEEVEQLVAIFGAAGISCRLADDFAREVWRKVLVNAAINPVTADHGILNGKLLDDPWRGQALQLLAEARSVAEAEGVRISPDEAESDLWRVVRATAGNRSSMLQDIDRRRRTEIEAISGELVRRGHRHGLSLPATERAVHRIEHRGQSPSH